MPLAVPVCEQTGEPGTWNRRLRRAIVLERQCHAAYRLNRAWPIGACKQSGIRGTGFQPVRDTTTAKIAVPRVGSARLVRTLYRRIASVVWSKGRAGSTFLPGLTGYRLPIAIGGRQSEPALP